jgi:hypothetical protein
MIHTRPDASPADYAGVRRINLALPSRLTRLGRGGIRTRAWVWNFV